MFVESNSVFFVVTLCTHYLLTFREHGTNVNSSVLDMHTWYVPVK